MELTDTQKRHQFFAQKLGNSVSSNNSKVERILDGVNAFNYNYNVKVDDCVINNMRDEFKSDLLKIFDGKVSIISEDEMFEVVDLIGGEYPHCNSR